MRGALVNVPTKKKYMDDEPLDKELGGEWINIEDPFARSLIESYLKRRAKDVEELRLHLEEDEFGSIRIKGHNLYGSGSAYGLDWISAIGKSMEDAAENKDTQAVADSIDALESYLGKIRVL